MVSMKKPYGKASTEDITAIESLLKAELPIEYKEFLTQYNGGRPDIEDFAVPGWGESLVNMFYGIRIDNTDYDLENMIDQFSEEIPYDEVIPIGDDPGGNQICIGIRGNYFGKVYFWDHEDFDDNELPSIFRLPTGDSYAACFC